LLGFHGRRVHYSLGHRRDVSASPSGGASSRRMSHSARCLTAQLTDTRWAQLPLWAALLRRKANTFARERESGFRLPASARTATPAVSCANGSYNPNRRQGRTSRTARTKWLGPTSRSPDAATKPATLSRADHRPSRRRKLDGTRGPTLVSSLARGGPSWSRKRPNTT
jgi:hypothetical protein